jgi:hypothetical protein
MNTIKNLNNLVKLLILFALSATVLILIPEWAGYVFAAGIVAGAGYLITYFYKSHKKASKESKGRKNTTGSEKYI